MALSLRDIIGESQPQKYETGDLVRIAKDLGPSMESFKGDCDAIILGSYDDLCGRYRGGEHNYSVFIKDIGPCAWYYESQLALLKKNQIPLLRQWREERKGKKG